MAEQPINEEKFTKGARLAQALATKPGQVIRKTFEEMITDRLIRICDKGLSDEGALKIRSELIGILACLETGGDLLAYANGVSAKLAQRRLREQEKSPVEEHPQL